MALLCVCSLQIKNGSLLIPVIYVLIALSGIARGFYGPAVFGLVADIVPRPLMGNAAAWNSAVWQASAVAGPVFGGYLYLWSSAPATYLVSTLLLIAAFTCFCFLKSEFALPDQPDDTSVVANIKEGLHFVFSNQVMLGAMALDLFAVLFGGAVALLPIFAQQVFHEGPQTLGMLRAAPSVGAFLTATFLTHRPITRHAGQILLVAVAGFGLCMIAFGLSTNLYLSLFLLGLSGLLDGVSVYLRTTIFQLVTPNEMKGRVSAVNNIFIGSSNEIGEFESGVTAKIMGLVPSVIFGGCMTLLVVLTTVFKAPKLRNLNMQSLYREEVIEPSTAT
jgi:MFS family permease